MVGDFKDGERRLEDDGDRAEVADSDDDDSEWSFVCGRVTL